MNPVVVHARAVFAAKYAAWYQQESTAYIAGVQAAQAAAAARAAAQAAEQAAASATAARAARTTAPPTASSSGGIPPSWQATATCEEGGRDDSNYGYFGIKEWGHFDGYPSAGSAPLSVQLAWEAAHGQGPPDAPGQCHDY